jgi:hypothetical protein
MRTLRVEFVHKSGANSDQQEQPGGVRCAMRTLRVEFVHKSGANSD